MGLCNDVDANVRNLLSLRIERVRRLNAWHVVYGSRDGSGNQVSSACIKSSRCNTCGFLAWSCEPHSSPLSVNHPADHWQHVVTVVGSLLYHLSHYFATITRYQQPAPFPLWIYKRKWNHHLIQCNYFVTQSFCRSQCSKSTMQQPNVWFRLKRRKLQVRIAAGMS